MSETLSEVMYVVDKRKDKKRTLTTNKEGKRKRSASKYAKLKQAQTDDERVQAEGRGDEAGIVM